VRRCAALFAGLLFGCTGPSVDFAELPSAPIAFVYRTVEETDRMLDEAEARLAAQLPRPEDEFGIEIEGLSKLAGRRTNADLVRDYQGRLGLFVAPTKSLELPDVMMRGARPIDWAPGHERLMFASTFGASHLFEWVLATGEVRQLTTGPGSQVDGCYSAAGAIVWEQPESTSSAAGSRIWLRRPGQAPRALTPGPADTQPACSPDGARIVYSVQEPRAGMQLRWIDPAVDAGGSLGPGRSATFSPDGRWIVYAALTPAGWRLRRMHADGSGKRSFGRSGFVESDPSFSPDGRFVAFSANSNMASPISRLFVRSFDSELDRQLEFSGSGVQPVW